MHMLHGEMAAVQYKVLEFVHAIAQRTQRPILNSQVRIDNKVLITIYSHKYEAKSFVLREEIKQIFSTI